MSEPLFDSYLVVDWSAAGSPKTGPDSIWWCLVRPPYGVVASANPATRRAAMAAVREILAAEADAGRRVLAGFDFPFGYPADLAKRLGCPDWQALWGKLAASLPDRADNRTERFAVAACLNRAWGTPGPFWGNATRTDLADLPRTKPPGYGAELPPEWRAVEAFQRAETGPNPKSVWQLAGAGSVGSQALTGIASLERLRHAPGVVGRSEVWPLETGLAVPTKAICIAEVYPSLVPARPRPGEVKDAAQTRRLAGAFAALDRSGHLGAFFEARNAPADLRSRARDEAWILGAGFGGRLAAAAASPGRPGLRYERDPKAIYAQSFATVRAETQLDHLPRALHDVAIRLVHSCGMTDLPNRLAWSDDLAPAACAALEKGAAVLCDCEMVASGVIRSRLPSGVDVLCTLNDAATRPRAEAIGTTRSAAAVELWRDRLAGSVVVIGNAPTALFRLLELIDDGWPRPAAILGFPVGFVGAAESKAELAANPRGVPFLTLRGRRGGSAMAAAALNALAGGLEA